jgi:adenosylmethionine---8-amino-7-oxononanoate aminotransferase
MRDVWNTRDIVALDKRHVWHPFTPMSEWCAPGHEPLVVARGRGAMLEDTFGRRYLDGNSSIWTNIHGHSHPRINEAVKAQLDEIAHVSFLGTTNTVAPRLAARLAGFFPPGELGKVFFSDDGSTAIEAAMKMAVRFNELTGNPERTGFVAFEHAYHGDTLGAASIGGIGAFHQKTAGYEFPVTRVGAVEDLEQVEGFHSGEIAAVVIEPLIQGVAGMRPWPAGMLAALRRRCDEAGVFLILDEVMTGFGRTGTMFACQQEGVVPDFLCLAKGLSGGYLPLAATLTTDRVFEAFLGDPSEGRTFYYGHSYSGNPLGCAAALASLDLFDEEDTLRRLEARIGILRDLLEELRGMPGILATRQCGFIAGIDVGAKDGSPLPAQLRTGAKVCLAAREGGLLTRPILDTVVFMPPLCTDEEELRAGINALADAVACTAP